MAIARQRVIINISLVKESLSRRSLPLSVLALQLSYKDNRKNNRNPLPIKFPDIPDEELMTEEKWETLKIQIMPIWKLENTSIMGGKNLVHSIVLVSLSSSNKIPETGRLKQQAFISHSSRG